MHSASGLISAGKGRTVGEDSVKSRMESASVVEQGIGWIEGCRDCQVTEQKQPCKPRFRDAKS